MTDLSMTQAEKRAHLLVTAYLHGVADLDFHAVYEQCVVEKRDEDSGAALGECLPSGQGFLGTGVVPESVNA